MIVKKFLFFLLFSTCSLSFIQRSLCALLFLYLSDLEDLFSLLKVNKFTFIFVRKYFQELTEYKMLFLF
jgi:hypothetical protein